jgi:lipopolysaccharide transport system permease protein
MILASALAIGAGLWIAALNVRYRDFRFIVPFAVQLGLYISPVGFSSEIVPPQWRAAYAVNPMVGVIDGFRWMLFAGSPFPDWRAVLLSATVAGILLVSAGMHFRRAETSFADDI